MSVLGTYAENIRSGLEHRFGFTFIPGDLGDIRNDSSNHLGCVWVDTAGEVAGRVVELEVRAYVRLLRQFDPSVPQDKYTSFDPAPLYDWVDELAAWTQANATLVGLWFFRVTVAKVIPAQQGVYAALLGYADNPFSPPA